MDCDNGAIAARDLLAQYLRDINKCTFKAGEHYDSLYDLNKDFIRDATIRDNQGEFFVHFGVNESAK